MPLDRRFVELHDEYAHAPLPRRVFLERLAALAGSAAAAEAALRLLEPQAAAAALLAPDDPRLRTERVAIEGANGRAAGYLARPNRNERFPALLVVHENRGLNPHIEDVARRFALRGFEVVAADFLTPLGGTPADPDAARDMIAKLPREAVLNQARAVLKALKRDPGATGFAGAVGFCWGGGIVNLLATEVEEMDAGVVFYGLAPALSAVPAIGAPLLLLHAERDARVNAGLPAYEAALKAAGKPYELVIYPNVDHAFHNDTSAERYDEATATKAFERAVEFLKREAGKPR